MYDIAIIGGGINGAGIARDAAGRGYRVLLCEQDDLAGGTSSGSTKLIHGGLRYLEHREFRLVRESLQERERLWNMAPHIVAPMRFVLPHRHGMRPAWLLRLGLFLYDNIGGRRALAGTETLDLSRDPAGAALKAGRFRRGFAYSDCWVDDARLVVLNARDAADRGGDVKVRTRVVSARRQGAGWSLTLEDRFNGRRSEVSAGVLVNAAGPWVDEVIGHVVGREDVRNVRLVQGSHIVVPALFHGEHAFILQNEDGRIVFAIPYEGRFTLIGTTDRDFAGRPGEAEISSAETEYLCRSVNAYFFREIGPADVVWSFSAVRPLYDDGASSAQEATRDYVIETEGGGGKALLVNVFGGKLTTYRRLAEAVMARIAAAGNARGRSWTGDSRLPGGEFRADAMASLVWELETRFPFMATEVLARLARSYGTLARAVLEGVERESDLGEEFGAGLCEREVRYLIANEWARTGDDILWRRSKLGLHMNVDQRRRLADFVADVVGRMVGRGGGLVGEDGK